jgi:CubicO group peptidase (beta-lactamase class C family)
LAVALLIIAGLANGQVATASLDDRAALEAWMDGAIAAQLEGLNIAGATVAVVKDGEVIFSKGYGYADVKGRVHVDPAKTLFRIGSVSKLFVWLSVMQLVEQGRLDLNADVNTYLSDVQVPRRYSVPVTMKHLMTHTPGFEDQVIGLFARDASKMRPLGEVLADEMPARVREPGRIASYSNHGTGLAMHVVESITGEPWEAYIQKHILDPLGMAHTVLAQPVPGPFSSDLSKGYAFDANVFTEKEFEFVPLGPVGGISAPADDMAKFMLTFLGNGEYAGARVLEESTARTMQSELHRMEDGVNPMDYGLMDMSMPGLRIIGHGGDTFYFHTLFALFPDHNTGLFASYNSSSDVDARGNLLRLFAERYYLSGEPERPAPVGDFETRAARYTGAYRVNRFSHKSLAKLGAALSPVNVRYDGEGALRVSATGAIRWIEVAPNTFQDEDGDRRLVFIEDGNGRITHIAFAELPILAFERIGPVSMPEVHGLLFAGTVLTCLMALILWPAAAIVRWRHGVIVSRQQTIPVRARWIGWIAAALVIAFVVMLLGGIQDPTEVAYGLSDNVKVILAIPLVVTVLAGVMLGITIHLWLQGRGRFFPRVWYSLVVLALAVFVWQVIFWNLTILQILQFL